MSNVVELYPAPIAELAVELERQAFEAFVVRGAHGPSEAAIFLTRSAGGNYVLRTTRAGWAAWQARANLPAEN